MSPVIEAIFHTLFSFFLLLILTRIMGRKKITQLTFFDYISGITIGSIAAVVAVDPSIDLSMGSASLVVWTACVMLMNVVTLSSISARKLIDAEPIIVIHNGQILEANLGKRYYNIHDLLMQLRRQGIFDPNEVEIGIMEPDGLLSIMKKSQFQPVTIKDLNIPPGNQTASKYTGMEIIVDGEILIHNLHQIGYDQQWLQSHLLAHGISDPAEIMLAAINPDGTLYIDKKTDNTPLTKK
jgi:uncharacterized membrane protein YcaP (DUF421 family)